MADDYFKPGYLGHPAGNYPGLSPDDQRRFNDGRRQAEYEAQQAAQSRQQEQQQREQESQRANRQREQEAQRAQQARWDRDQQQQRRDQQYAAERLASARSSQQPANQQTWFPPPSRSAGHQYAGPVYAQETRSARRNPLVRFVAFVFKAIVVVILLLVALLIVAEASKSTSQTQRGSAEPARPPEPDPAPVAAREPDPAPAAAREPDPAPAAAREPDPAPAAAPEPDPAPAAAPVRGPADDYPDAPPPAPALIVTVAGNPNAQPWWSLHFFDETTGGRWPADPAQSYPYHQAQVEIRLPCYPSHVVCVGGWRADGYLWGVGYDNNPARRDGRSCRVCGSGVLRWDLPSPPSP